MKAAIPSLDVATANIGAVAVGQLNAGPLSIGRLTLDATHVTGSTGGATFKNLQVTVDLAFSLTWTVTVDITLVGSWSWDGTIDLGSLSLPFSLEDVALPGLESLSIDLPSVSVDGVSAVAGPLQDLQLGPLVVRQLHGAGVVAPVPDFQVAGIGLTAVALQGLSVPGASLDTVHVGSLTGGSVPLGSLTLPNLQLPAASVADIVSQGLDVRMVGSQESLGGGGGLLSVSLNVVPAARVQVDELTISGVQASASVGSVQLTDVVLPFEVLDVTLSQLGIETVTVPTVEVS